MSLMKKEQLHPRKSVRSSGIDILINVLSDIYTDESWIKIFNEVMVDFFGIQIRSFDKEEFIQLLFLAPASSLHAPRGMVMFP